MSRSLNAALTRSIVAAALGGCLLGFDTAVISGATGSLAAMFRLSPGALGATVASALWGTVIGALAAGVMGRKLGGRTSLLWLAGCYLASAIGCAFAADLPMFIVFRIIGGLGIGGSSVIAPVYIAEVAPAQLRGRLVGMFQINTVAGILLAYGSNYLLGLERLGGMEWRWQLGVAAIPATAFLLMMMGNPPSPRWLAMRGRTAEARLVLGKLGSVDPSAALSVILASFEEKSPQADRLFSWTNRRPIIFAVLIAIFNQFTGINAVLYYLNDIFGMAGFDRTSQNLQAVTVGGTMLVATTLALTAIDKLGRKTLLLVGAAGMAACLGGIGAIFGYHRYEALLLPLLIGYVAFFAFSQGTVIWVYLSEIFPGGVRAQGQSLGSSTHWVMNALISGMFPLIAARSHAGPFVLFMVFMIVQFVVVGLFFPETSRVSLEEIQHCITQ